MGKFLTFILAIFIFGIFGGMSLFRLPYLASPQDQLVASALTGEFIPGELQGFFHNQLVSVPSFIADIPSTAPVLGFSTSNKRLEVDLTNQRLYAFEGDNKIYDFLISSGKWGPTPTGTFQFWTKLRYTKMSGGSKALHTYYYLPNVPYTMYFYNNEVPKSMGYGVHGAYWHSNFGHPMSHGCINMKPEEAGIIYQWTEPVVPANKRMVYATDDNPSTPLIIYGTPPKT